ncbi:MAG: Lrp/AsnC family transcriptional regulator, partial [Comamonadaceae bacterium]
MKPATDWLDRTDLKILSLLQQDGRLSNVELAERVSLSPTPCLRRVKRLEEAGVIAFYRAELDRRQLGLGVTAFVCINIADHG